MDEPRVGETPASVQLGYGEVDPTLLEPAGSELGELLGPREGIEVRVDAHRWSRLPQGGWRPVREDVLPYGVRQVLAAPHPAGGWVSATFFDRGNGERVLIGGDPDPVRVQPGRATRRALLVLRWPAPVAAAAVGSLPELHVELTNTAPQRWTNVAGDRGHVAGWVQHLSGRRVAETSPWVITTGIATLPDLEPGQHVNLPVILENSGIDQLPAGHYQLEATLLDLDMHAPPEPLQLT